MKTRTMEFWFSLTLIAVTGLLLVAYALGWETVYTVVPFFVILLCPVMLNIANNDSHGVRHAFRHGRRTGHQYLW